MADRKILKVIDKSDSYYTPMDGIPDLPFRMIVVGKSQLSGKSTIILNLLLRPEFYGGKFQPEDIYLISNNKLDNKLRILADQLDVPGSNIMKFSEDRLQAIYDHIEDMASDAVNDGDKPVNSLMVIDDCSYSGDFKSKIDGVISLTIPHRGLPFEVSFAVYLKPFDLPVHLKSLAIFTLSSSSLAI